MNDIKLAQQRLVMSKMKLDILRRISIAYFGNNRTFGAQITDLLICLAVLIGQIEGRPMNPTKLSDYAGVPRPTVIRRLNVMSKRGIVQRNDDNTYCLLIEALNAPEVVRVAELNVQTVIDSASNLDVGKIAQRESDE